MVGDRWLDVECGVAAGTRAIQVLSGHGTREDGERAEAAKASAILSNLMEAVGWILRSSSR
jgi:phosphoglycolate phosphatase-like HAD superfamily hydrolase